MAMAMITQKHNYWRIPRIWQGETCAILGGGPSLTNLRKADYERLKGLRVIAVNCAYRQAPWAEAMYFGDSRWLEAHGSDLADFPALKITSHIEHQGKYGLKVVRRENREGVSTDPGVLYWNSNSGACAINLAVLLGAGRIILLGFDMQRVGGRSNYHNYYKPINPKFDPYYKFLPPFEKIARDLAALKIECLNATPGSALTVFPIVKPEDVL